MPILSGIFDRSLRGQDSPTKGGLDMNRRMLVYGLFLCALAVSVTSATAASDSAEFTALPGSPKGGVIVYLGSADADTVIKSRDAGRFLVQGVLFDQAAVVQGWSNRL